MSTQSHVAGRTLIREKALKSLVTGVAAEVLGVPMSKVNITISDEQGLLALTVHGPLSKRKAGDTLLAAAETARQQLCEKVTEISNRQVATCLLELDGLQRKKRGRVL